MNLHHIKCNPLESRENAFRKTRSRRLYLKIKEFYTFNHTTLNSTFNKMSYGQDSAML